MDEVQDSIFEFDRYAPALLELGAGSLLEHVKYWRTRCLLIEQAAGKLLHPIMLPSLDDVPGMDALQKLLDTYDEPAPSWYDGKLD